MIPRSLEKISYPRTRFKFRKQVNAEIDTLLVGLRKQLNKGLHLGAGAKTIPGLVNCDLYNPAADLKLDATNLSTIEDCTVDWIESHHMIEHLSFADTERALAEWHRVLSNRGMLILTCPDILKISINWVIGSCLYSLSQNPAKLDYMVKMLVGSQEHDGMFHRNAFDYRRMSRVLSTHGFNVEFSYSPYPLRPTPSLLVIARKR
jgi:predicted SAM-dependent methyltransferase